MPMPSVNTVLQMAYAEVQRLAAQQTHDRGTPETCALLEQVWTLVKERLAVDDERVKAIDGLIRKLVAR